MEPFNRILLITIVCVSVVLVAKLYLVGSTTDNMRGFWYSSLHILIVAIGGYYALRKTMLR